MVGMERMILQMVNRQTLEFTKTCVGTFVNDQRVTRNERRQLRVK